MLMPGPPDNSIGGWHTRRLRGEPGYEWAEIELPAEGLIRRIEVDTGFYRGDFPELVEIEDCATGAKLLDPTPLRGDFLQRMLPAQTNVPTGRVRVKIYPDGGIARLRLLGSLTDRGRESHRLMLRNTLPPPDAVGWFEQCLDSEEWARQMTSARPFGSMDQMKETAGQIANSLSLEFDAEVLRARLQL